ncbi:MAG: hypothetical protein J6S49_02665, partial [Erysipelotrichaceae bacterium]|nr:hypothetical protein [Erysipelotrichaceae bacterium]
VAGNPLPSELLMLTSSPFLLLTYLVLVGLVSGTLVNFEAFLGFSSKITNTTIAMPGSFADFIINIRNASLFSTIRIILIVGVIAFIAMFTLTMFYYRFIAFDFTNSGTGKRTVKDLIEAAGGKDNIINAGSGLFCLNIDILDPEKISIEKIQEIGLRRVVETRSGLSFELGTSSYGAARLINREISR